MKRLILTSLSGTGLTKTGLGELVIVISFRFVWGQLPSLQELAAYVGPDSDAHGPGTHWSDFVVSWPRSAKGRKHLALAEFCEPYDIIELWFDPAPNDQLELIWLIDHLQSHPEVAAKTKLRLIGFDLTMTDGEGLSPEHVPLVRIRPADIKTASLCWQAYRASTPEGCFDMVSRDLSAFPLLRPALLDLLQELPWSGSGLGATETRLLDLIGTGFMGTNMLFYLRGFRQRGVFSDFEIGTLLEGLAHGPRPAIAGLDDELRTLSREDLGGRLKAYQRSRLSLTEFGTAVLAHEEDFSSHNPIDRWWGGTRLTNEQLWRFDPVLGRPR